MNGNSTLCFIENHMNSLLTLLLAALMCVSAGYFAATLPPVALAVWILQKYYLRTSRQVRLLDLEAKSPLYSHFIESLSGLVTIRAFGWQANFEVRTIHHFPKHACYKCLQELYVGTKSKSIRCFAKAILLTFLHPALAGPCSRYNGYVSRSNPDGIGGQIGE